MSANWEKNWHPVGVWVRYGEGVSHKYAFSVLSQGVWEAFQRPDDFNISRELFPGTEGNPPPYAELTNDPMTTADFRG